MVTIPDPYVPPGLLDAMERLGERAGRSSNPQPEEKKPAPSPQSRRVDDFQEKLRKSLDPPVLDIYSAQSLNALLNHLKDLRAMHVAGPKVPLRKDVLQAINVVSDHDTGSVGLLKNQGRLSWPVPLRETEFEANRELLNSLVPNAIEQAGHGRVDSDQLKVMRTAVEELKDQFAHSKKEPASKIARLTPGEYIKAQRFLTQLKDAVQVLAQPDGENYFNGRYAPRVETVAQLVEHMTKEGLRFAPAEDGDEAGYQKLHRALAVYVVASHNSQHAED